MHETALQSQSHIALIAQHSVTPSARPNAFRSRRTFVGSRAQAFSPPLQFTSYPRINCSPTASLLLLLRRFWRSRSL